MRATKIGRLTIWQLVGPAIKRINSVVVSYRLVPIYLTHFTCAFTAIVCAVPDISLETMKWYVPGPRRS